jgi:hypothetical protein
MEIAQMRLTIPTLLLLLLCAYSCTDNVSPITELPDQESDPPDTTVYGIHDLHLDVTISATTIIRGDTLGITMIARNPRGGVVRAGFPYTCQEAYWVYDDSGHCVVPECRGYAMPTRLEIMPAEEREYHLSWRACPVPPGSYTLIVGFNSSLSRPRHAADPIPIEVLGREESVTGAWKGSCFRNEIVPGWLDYRFTMVLNQVDSSVSGYIWAGGPAIPISSGTMVDNKLVFLITLENHDSELEFTGDVCGDGIAGPRLIRTMDTGEVVDTTYWHARRLGRAVACSE